MKKTNTGCVAVIIFTLVSSFGVIVHAQPIVPPHIDIGLELPDWLVGGFIGFFLGGVLCGIIFKIGEAIERALRDRDLIGGILIARWVSGVVGLLIGLLTWAATITFFVYC